MRRRIVLALCFLFLVTRAPIAAEGDSPTRHALLVGCTRYPDLAVRFQLSGCGNDTELMQNLLLSRFGFKKENIQILSEKAGDQDEKYLPFRAHIQREFQRLAEVVKPGDKVVIFLAGHGSQQPAENPDDPENPEPDGLDEIFLPADTRGWDGKNQEVTNAIVDKEMAVWLKAIRDRKATLVVIIDACHSAGLVRGGDDSRARGIPIEELVPKEAIRLAREKAARVARPRTRGGNAPPPFRIGGQAPDFVALYATQSTETEPEDKFPASSPDSRYHGLFTYTLVEVLTQSTRPLTYTELVQRIQATYIQTRTSFPLPLVEGKYREQEFLGEREWQGRSRFELRRRGELDWVLNAGSLHGLTPGSILAVYPRIGTPGDDKVAGHVKIEAARVLDATVRPVAHAGLPLAENLPEAGRCVPVYTHHGLEKMRVAVEDSVPAPIRQALQKVAGKPGALIEPIAQTGRAQWLIHSKDDHIVLLPIGAGTRGAPGEPDRAIGPAPIDDRVGAWLDKQLTAIARARNLIGLAAAMGAEGSEKLNVTAELVSFPTTGAADRKAPPTLISWTDRGLVLKAGEQFGVRCQNNSRYPVWLTILFIDSDHAILPFWPPANTAGVENRIKPGGTFVTPAARVTAKTLGLEHMVFIAVKASNDESVVDFTCLCQDSLSKARGGVRGDPDLSLESPLGQLFQTALYAQGNSRGWARETLDDYALQLISFRTLAREDEARNDSPPGPAPAQILAKEGGPSFWGPVLYVGGGLLAGMALVLMMNRRLRAAK